MTRKELEERLIDFAVMAIEISESLVIALKIIHKAKLYESGVKIQFALNECNELVSIFVKSIETKKANMEKREKR